MTLRSNISEKKTKEYLLMDQITFNRKDQQKPIRSPHRQSQQIPVADPLDGSDFTVGRGDEGPDLDGAGERGGGVPPEDEDEGSRGAGDGEGLGVEGGEDTGVGEPPLGLSGADRSEIVAGDAPNLRHMRSPRHLPNRDFWGDG